MHALHTIVVFSHLQWDFVYQRPQHVLSRLATQRRVIFVQEPVYSDSEPFWELREAENGVLVCIPHTPVEYGGFVGEQVPLLIGMVKDLLESQEVYEYVAWLYTPMALPV